MTLDRRTRRSLWVATIGLVVAFVATFARLGAQDTSTGTNQVLSVGGLDELRARTPEERARVKYFDRFGGDTPIAELLAKGLGWVRSEGAPIVRVGVDTIIHGQNFSPEEIRAMKEAERRQLEEERRQSVCLRDVIVVGRATPVRVLMNTAETWLFTDYAIDVDRWIRQRTSNSPTPTAAIDRVLGSQLGGEVMVAGRKVSTTGPLHMPLGTPSLFWLMEMPGGGGSLVGAPRISNGGIWDSSTETQLTPDEYIAQVTRDAAACSPSR